MSSKQQIVHGHCRHAVNKTALTLIHTNQPLLSTHPAYTLWLLYINTANNRYNVIGSVTCHTRGIVHNTTLPPFLQTKNKEKDLSLPERLINTL